MTSAFLTLTKGNDYTTNSKVTDVEVSVFSEYFLFLVKYTFHKPTFVPLLTAYVRCAEDETIFRSDTFSIKSHGTKS